MRAGVTISAAAIALLVAAVPARAAEQQAYAAGLTYLTPVAVAGKGDTLRFNNLDPLARHDIVSDVPGRFASSLIGAGESAPVNGVSRLPPGSYAFHCSLHSWMRGSLQVAAAGGMPKLPSPTPPGGGGAPAAPNPVDLLPKAKTEPLSPGEWPFYGKDLANSRNGGDAGPSYNEVLNMGPVWSFASKDGDFTGTPVVSQGTLVVASGGGTVTAMDATDGKVRWSRDLVPDADESKASINASAAISGGRVFVALAKTGDPRLVALSLADGSVLWNADLDDQKDADTFGSPVAWDGKVFIGTSAYYGEVNQPDVSARGSVVAVNAETGARVWKTFTVPEGHDGGAVWTTPAVDTDARRVFVGTGNAYHAPSAGTTDSMLALDADSGVIAHHFQATANDVWNATGNAAAGPDYDFGASPNLIEGPRGEKLVGEGQKSGAYWAVRRQTMMPFWSARTGPGAPAVGGVVGSTAYDGKRVYGPDTPAGEVWALGRDGRLAWVSADGDPLHFSAASVANGVVWTTDLAGFLNAREATTGLPLAKLPLGAPSWGGVAIAGGSVFAVTGTQGTSGYVVAYRPRG